LSKIVLILIETAQRVFSVTTLADAQWAAPVYHRFRVRFESIGRIGSDRG
jgi:hypothetical protein